MADTKTRLPRHPLVFRILHEVMMASILILVVTGLYIHKPFTATGWGMMMSMMRGTHFFAAALLTVTVGLRILGMFIGKYRDWRSFVPGTDDLKALPNVLAYYGYARSKPEMKKKYNALQMVTYGSIIVLTIIQIILGFAMQYPDGWLRFINYWLFVTEVNTRIFHYILTWVFILFLIVHVHLSIRESFQEMKQVHLFKKEEDEVASQEAAPTIPSTDLSGAKE